MAAAEASVTVPYTLFKEEVRKRNVQPTYSRGDTTTGCFATPVTCADVASIDEARNVSLRPNRHDRNGKEPQEMRPMRQRCISWHRRNKNAPFGALKRIGFVGGLAGGAVAEE